MKKASIVLLILGILVLLQVGFPLLSFKLWEIANISSDLPLISPQVSSEQVLGISVEQTPSNFPAFISTLQRDSKPLYDKFYLSIPSLKIDQAEVLVDSNNLTTSLAHLPGSALPGEKGNVFISGHSVLPLIFTKDTSTLFGNLPKLKVGDEVKIGIGKGQFSYKIIGMRIVDPKDLSVILPPDRQGRYITLMTCVPPGLNTKRLVMLGQLN